MTLDQVFALRSKRSIVADIQRQPELPSHTTVISRVKSCCSQAQQQTWCLDAENTITVLSKVAASQAPGNAKIRGAMYNLFLKDFRPLCRFATSHGTEINMLRCMVDGTATAEFPAWQNTIQVAVCDTSNAVVAAALIIPVNAALAWMPILSVQPHLRGKQIGQKLVAQIVDLLSSFFLDSLLIPSSNESKLIKWWIQHTRARRMTVDELDTLIDSFPCLCDIDKTKMLVAKLAPAQDSRGGAEATSTLMQRRAEARLAARRAAQYNGVITWEANPNGKRPRSIVEDPT